MLLEYFLLTLTYVVGHGRIVNFEEEGGLPDEMSDDTAWKNGNLMNVTLNSLLPGDTFFIPNKTFLLMGGIRAYNLTSITFQLDGTIVFSDNMDQWPRESSGDVFECIHFFWAQNVTFTSSGVGTLDGQGSTWWGLPGIGYLVRGENRPRLFNIVDSKDILVENLFFLNSPYWTFWVHGVDGLEVRFCEISARRTDQDHHGIIDLTAFNTDGFDVTGRNVWIHDCTVWDQDDCIAVKDNSENMLFERITASGVGLTIWIGPAQQSDSPDLCAAHPCSLCWPQLADVGAECNMDQNFIYENITLRNITIVDPKFQFGQGVVLGNPVTPMKNVVFDGVKVINAENPDLESYYACEGVEGVALGDTYPVPACFEDQTTPRK